MEDPMTFKKETMQNFNQKFSNPFYGESLTDSEKFKSENQTSNGFVNAQQTKYQDETNDQDHLHSHNGHRISFNHQGISQELMNKLNSQFMGYLNSEQNSVLSDKQGQENRQKQ